jgi:hypothetical protein
MLGQIDDGDEPPHRASNGLQNLEQGDMRSDVGMTMPCPALSARTRPGKLTMPLLPQQ